MDGWGSQLTEGRHLAREREHMWRGSIGEEQTVGDRIVKEILKKGQKQMRWPTGHVSQIETVDGQEEIRAESVSSLFFKLLDFVFFFIRSFFMQRQNYDENHTQHVQIATHGACMHTQVHGFHAAIVDRMRHRSRLASSATRTQTRTRKERKHYDAPCHLRPR